MISLFFVLLGALFVFVGCLVCVIPLLPGPIVGFCGILCLLLTKHSPSTLAVVVLAVLMILATALDYVVPAAGAKKFKCSWMGVVGCLIGSFLGVFFFPLGLLIGPFLGAFLGEVVAGRDFSCAARGGVGALLGFMSGVLIKLSFCISMAIVYCRCVFR